MGPKPRPGEIVKARGILAASAAAVILASALLAPAYREVTLALGFYKSAIAVIQGAAEMQALAFEATVASRPGLDTQWRARHAELTASAPMTSVAHP